MVKNYYITGITGFLGYNLFKVLNKENVKFIGFALENDPNIKLFDNYKNVKIIKGNILNKKEVEDFLSFKTEGEKYLIHAAGKITTLKKGDDFVNKINYEGTKNIVDTVKNMDFKKVIYISSVDAMKYRKDKEVIKEQEIYKVNETVGIYGKSKVLASNYIKENLNNYIIIMPSAILGPDDPLDSAINNAIKKAINNKLSAIVNGGYNLVDVRDVALGIEKAINSNKINEYYLFTGHYILIKDLMKKVSKFSNCKKYKLIVSHIIIKGIAPFIEIHAKKVHKTPLFTGFSMDCLKQNANYSYQKAFEDLGYKPRDLDLTIKDTILFLEKRK